MLGKWLHLPALAGLFRLLFSYGLQKILSLIRYKPLFPVSLHHKLGIQTLICLISLASVHFSHLVLILAPIGTKYFDFLFAFFFAFFLASFRGQILIEVLRRVVKGPVAVVVLDIVRLWYDVSHERPLGQGWSRQDTNLEDDVSEATEITKVIQQWFVISLVHPWATRCSQIKPHVFFVREWSCRVLSFVHKLGQVLLKEQLSLLCCPLKQIVNIPAEVQLALHEEHVLGGLNPGLHIVKVFARQLVVLEDRWRLKQIWVLLDMG